MIAVNPTRAKAGPSELLGKAEAGEEVTITRLGNAVARRSASHRPKSSLPPRELAEFRMYMPLLRRIRDG